MHATDLVSRTHTTVALPLREHRHVHQAVRGAMLRRTMQEDRMRAYKVIPPRSYAPVAYLSGMDNAKPLDAALEEFQATYGFRKDNTIRDLRGRNQAQMNLARDASFLGLEHNPLYHDISLVFVDWAKKRFGYRTVDPNEAASDAEDFKFPY